MGWSCFLAVIIVHSPTFCPSPSESWISYRLEDERGEDEEKKRARLTLCHASRSPPGGGMWLCTLMHILYGRAFNSVCQLNPPGAANQCRLDGYRQALIKDSPSMRLASRPPAEWELEGGETSLCGSACTVCVCLRARVCWCWKAAMADGCCLL